MWLSLCVCGALATCAYALLQLLTRRARRLLAPLPTYPQLPFLGNVHQIFGNSEHLFGVLKSLAKILEETNMPFVLWIGPRPVVVVSDPDDVKAVTNAFVEKPYYYSFASEWVGNGLVTAPSDIWKRNIKKLSGTFSGNIVDGYQAVFDAQAAKLVGKLRGEVGAGPFDVLNKYLAYTTLEAICQTALGVPRISDNIVSTEYYRSFVRTFELLVERGMNLVYHLDFLYRLSPGYKEYKSCIAVLHNVSDTIMTKRKQERDDMKSKGILPDNSSDDDKPKFKAFLDILLDLKEVDSTMTEQQIKSEIDTIIVGGQETVATTLFVTFVLIGCKPDIQNKLYAEMREIFGDSRRPVTKEDLLRMKYCDALIHETLRMFPPIPFIMRDADKDLETRACTIPKGTGCGVHAWSAGRSKRAWGPDAHEYRPERWLEPGGFPGYPSSFLAFSYGRRSCIGKRYALAILKTVLAHCVRELEFSSEGDDALRLKVDVGLKPISGHLIQVRLRT